MIEMQNVVSGELRQAPFVRFAVRALERVVLAERMSHPVVRHEDSAKVGMIVEGDAEQVEDLTLQPVGRSPDLRGSWMRQSASLTGVLIRRRSLLGIE